MHTLRILSVFLLMFISMSNLALAEQMQLPVSVTFRERIAVPPDAILEVEILDVSRADAAATKLSYMRFKLDKVPFEASLAYDDALIDERLNYVVSARIMSGGEVIFRNTSSYPVLTRDAAASADLILQRMPVSVTQKPPHALAGINWVAFEIGGRMLVADDPPTIAFQEDGRFSFFGGCNRFTGQAEIGEGTVIFPEAIAGTRRACVPERDRLETDFVEALTETTRFERNGNIVAFQNQAGVVKLRFRSAPL